MESLLKGKEIRMRLDKVLTHVGYGSRKEVQNLIKSKQVYIDGKCTLKADEQVNPEHQIITVSGKKITYQKQYYYLLNKPAGYISATEDYKEQTVIDLLASIDQNKGLFPVGRLDKDTEGLLILTTDGQLAHQLLAPKKHIPKVYYAKLRGRVEEKDKEIVAQGITLANGTVYKPGVLEIISSGDISEVYVTICEGQFHQVKEMMKFIGKEVLYLKRIQMGGLKLPDDLALGQYRALTKQELELLS